MFRKARVHKRETGPGRQIVKEKSHKWKIDPEVMDIIVNLLTSKEEMQSVAHGTLKITLDSGEKTRCISLFRILFTEKLFYT